MCRQRWKTFDENYNFALNFIAIRGLQAKLWAPKVAGIPIGQKAIWMWPLWRGAKYTIRGKVVASPKSGLCWVLWVWVCLWLVLAPKVLQLCTNHFVLVLCRSVWVVEACQFFLAPSQSSSMPIYPFKMMRAKERAPTSCSFVVFYLGPTFGVPQGVRSA